MTEHKPRAVDEDLFLYPRLAFSHPFTLLAARGSSPLYVAEVISVWDWRLGLWVEGGGEP